jgi:thioredoxin reductase
MAAQEGHDEIVAMLLKVGKADPNQAKTDSGATPLCMAAQEGHTEVVAVLLNVGKADPNIEMIDGPTPLEIAEENSHKDIADLLRQAGGQASRSFADSLAGMAEKKDQLPDITVQTSTGDYTTNFVVWAGGEFQYPKSIPHTVRVGHGTGYAAYADLPRGNHVVIGGSESGMDITHFLVGLGDTVTVLDASAPWNRRESDSSYGLSPYTFDRLHTLQASGKVKFIAERAERITPTEIKTKSQTIPLTNLAIDATGFDISKSIAGKLFNFQDGVPKITRLDESTICENVFLVGPHVQHQKAVFCFIYKYRQRFAVVAKEILARLGVTKGAPILQEYAKKNFFLEDLSECGDACVC